MEYASNAKGNLGVTLGAIGTGLGILDGGASVIGKMLGGGGNSSPEDKPVSRYELGLVRETIDQKIENSYLRGQLDFSNKFAEQGAFNASVATQIGNLQNGFNSLTRVFVPNENVAPGWGFANVQPAPPLPPYPYPFFPPFPPISAPGTTTTPTTSTNTGN